MNNSQIILETNCCRYPYCNKPANGRHACCSVDCRNKIPTCNVENCNNATEVGIYKGIYTYSLKCYDHGGRMEYDGISQNYEYLEHSKRKYRYKNGEWILVNCDNKGMNKRNIIFDPISRLYTFENNIIY
jgi:hypothetical protein